MSPFKCAQFLAINIGSDEWNYQVKDLAEAVAKVIPGVDISINKDAQPDKRSYKVSFDKFKSLAPDNQPQYNLKMTISDLVNGLKDLDFNDKNFRQSRLIRLFVVNEFLEKKMVDNSLRILK